MRSHRDVIREGGGVAAFARKLNLSQKPTTVQSWWQRGRIPSEYWLLIVELHLASWVELGVADAVRRERRRDRTAA
jgi:hypothetical protein